MHHSKKLGTLRFNDVTSTRTSKKTIGLISKTTTLHVHHALLYISLPFVHDYGVKMPNFVFYGMENVNKQRRNYLSLPELEWCLGIQIQSLMPFTASLVWPFSIINRVEQLWTPSDSCYMFLWSWRCTTFNNILILLILFTNKYVVYNLFRHILITKTEDCQPSGSFQRKLPGGG